MVCIYALNVLDAVPIDFLKNKKKSSSYQVRQYQAHWRVRQQIRQDITTKMYSIVINVGTR